jgi:hypothetical protein
MRNSLSSITALAAALFLLGGCNRAESPGEVAHDTQEAQAEGQQEVAKAEQDAASDQMAANQAMPGVESPAENNYEVQVARAEADHKVAVERCEALAGDEQKACKDSADAQLDASKAEAERQRAVTP